MENIIILRKKDGINRFTPIYVYTACTSLLKLQYILEYADGITLTLHEKEDGEKFFSNSGFMYLCEFREKSLRLNIFEGIAIPDTARDSIWKIKDNIKWIKNCSLPKDELFCKDILF